jgi:hypothetical protein
MEASEHGIDAVLIEIPEDQRASQSIMTLAKAITSMIIP